MFEITDELWTLLFTSIPIAVISGIFTDLIVRKYLPTKLDKAHKRNRKQYIDGLFAHISFVDSYSKSIEKYLKSHKRYGKDTKLDFEQDIFNEITRFRNLIHTEISNCPGYTSVSSFLSHTEFLLIMKYMKSADNLVSIRNLENSYHVDLKTKEYHNFYAKLLLEILGNQIPEQIRKKWAKNLQDMGMFYPAYNPPKVAPGDIVDEYDLIKDPLIFNDKILERKIERKIDFIVRKINDQEKADNQGKVIDQDKS